jgi:hypothetical protein
MAEEWAIDVACCFENRVYFTKRGLNKQTVLHELYHQPVYVNGLEMPSRTEEKAANSYARLFLK